MFPRLTRSLSQRHAKKGSPTKSLSSTEPTPRPTRSPPGASPRPEPHARKQPGVAAAQVAGLHRRLTRHGSRVMCIRYLLQSTYLCCHPLVGQQGPGLRRHEWTAPCTRLISARGLGHWLVLHPHFQIVQSRDWGRGGTRYSNHWGSGGGQADLSSIMKPPVRRVLEPVCRRCLTGCI